MAVIQDSNAQTVQTASAWLEAVTHRGLAGTGVTREEAQRLADPSLPVSVLFDAANAIRQQHFGNTAHFCGIVNARSGSCSSDCRFCAQSAHAQTDAPKYPLLEVSKIVDEAREAHAGGVSCFGIITSGPTATAEEVAAVCRAVAQIRAETGMHVSASLGMQGKEALKELKQAGVTRYHHNLETSRAFFPQVCTTHSWDARLATLKRAKSLGMGICSGGIFGIGENWEDRIDLALVLRELEVGSIPINFLNPVPGTALADQPPLTAEEALKIIALFRFVLPTATIRVCGGRPLVLKDQQAEIFGAGANALMTGDYLTTSGITPETDRQMLAAAGLTLGLSV